MSRKPREYYPGAAFHIYARGNKRAPIFHEPKDFQKYLEILEATREKYPFILHAYCLMSNHLHLQLQPKQITRENIIPNIMKYAHMHYAIYLNKKLEIDGHVFQGRFQSKIIIPTDYFLTLSRYIHRNPLEAHIVSKPEEYQWSSYSAYINQSKNPHIDTTKTLSYFPEPTYLSYREFVERDEEDDVNKANKANELNEAQKGGILL
ncbi:transposase [Bacillus sp. DNRA2]|uniref:transposase n=1 Tax=Bacillus sp. DNRA2 TaxID=2723053 RepID=UPI002006DDBA|nr:transposase [Bacillus sp. DNRA2]